LKEVLASIEVYDPSKGFWKIYSHLPDPRSGVRAVVLGDRIYILGGFNGTGRLRTVACFTPGLSRCTWHEVPSMINRRSNFAVSVLEGKIYVSGKNT